jgi:hypothetical protein
MLSFPKSNKVQTVPRSINRKYGSYQKFSKYGAFTRLIFSTEM